MTQADFPIKIQKGRCGGIINEKPGEKKQDGCSRKLDKQDQQNISQAKERKNGKKDEQGIKTEV